MTQENKELLFRDLCARLPYGVKVNNEIQGDFNIYGIYKNFVFVGNEVCHIDFNVEKIKPYLFPLSSMTEEQRIEASIEFNLKKYMVNEYGDIESYNRIEDDIAYIDIESISRYVDWLNKNHFDHRGLIEKGLAIDATGLNMENKINVAELLKDCPKGMELDCTMYDNLYFDEVDEKYRLPISCYTIYQGNKNTVFFTEFGAYNGHETAKCVIFPKGKTTWKGFVPPIEYKAGDIIISAIDDNIHLLFSPDTENGGWKSCCSIRNHNFDSTRTSHVVPIRFATEKEREKLFNAIKDNGYYWDIENKTLKKLVFKIGDKVRYKNNHNVVFTITSIEEHSYVCGAKAAFWFDDQDSYELVPNKFDITTLVPFESKVLVRDNIGDNWKVSFWGCTRHCSYDFIYDTVRGYYRQCIPYENNEHLLGKTDDCDEFYKIWE